MRNTFPRIALFAVIVHGAWLGCAGSRDPGQAPPPASFDRGPQVQADDSGGNAPRGDGGVGRDDQDDQHVSPQGPTAAEVGIVVIDVQDAFAQSAANANMPQILANIRSVLQLAGTTKTSLFITYEASKEASTGHALVSSLIAAMPGHAQEFIKTTFAATGLPAFAKAVGQAGLTHLIVVGAETDVCVLQTVLGLRKLGFTVILQTDAVFTSEPNTAPALRRMQQAGVLLANMTQVRSYLERTSPVPTAPAGVAIKVLAQTGVAFVLGNFDDASLAAAQDGYAAAKIARLKELLLIGEWFDVPLYRTSASTGLPSQFSGVITKALQPVTQLAQNSAIRQIVFAGTDGDLSQLVSTYGAARDVFLLADALLAGGPAGTQPATLEQLYRGGAVPLTYKSLYYGMTKSVNLQEWPQGWVDRDPTYYPKTQAPEDLPAVQ